MKKRLAKSSIDDILRNHHQLLKIYDRQAAQGLITYEHAAELKRFITINTLDLLEL